MNRVPPFWPSPLQVWAADATSIQICWGDLPPGQLRVTIGDLESRSEHPGGPGAVTVDGLTSATDHSIVVDIDGRRSELRARTLTPPPGEVVARVATVSDLHLGAGHWGFFRTMVDLSGNPEPAPTRCARAAITEAAAWGADHLVIKGDAAHHRRPDHYARLGDLVDEFTDLPMTLIPGNHDVDNTTHMDIPTSVGHRNLPMTRSVAIEDLPGIRVVSVDTTIEGRGIGTFETNGAEAIDAAASADRGVLMLLHHQIQRHRYPTHHPPGISKAEGLDFLRELGRRNPDTWVSSGHTHRNRARSVGPVQLSEVASTRDWPGVWAGYEIREGGISQTVRRIEAHDAITWHEYSRGAVLGVWSAWAQGARSQRSLSKRWASR